VSRAYLYRCAESLNELDRWTRDTLREMEKWPSAYVQSDTGPMPCRLIPIVPMASQGFEIWFPMPPIRDLDAVKARLSEHGAYYDANRKSKPGYERALVISV
jgi:hypothetical protein